MKAIVQDRYGPLEEVLRPREVETPVPATGQVLVRVRAASVHIGDCHMIGACPALPARWSTGHAGPGRLSPARTSPASWRPSATV